MNILSCARLLERRGIMRSPVVQNRMVINEVAVHDVVMRGRREVP